MSDRSRQPGAAAELRAGSARISRARRALMRLGLATPTFDEMYRPDRLGGPGLMSVGKWTYWNHSSTFSTFSPDDVIEVGAFCAFAAGTHVVAGGGHSLESISGFPFDVMSWTPGAAKPANTTSSRVRVGSDVWLGTNAVLLPGVTVGDGAVIGAGSVVTHDVAPYSVVAGVPARVVRMRFEPDEIEELLRIGWWNWPDEVIAESRSALRSESLTELRRIAQSQGGVD